MYRNPPLLYPEILDDGEEEDEVVPFSPLATPVHLSERSDDTYAVVKRGSDDLDVEEKGETSKEVLEYVATDQAKEDEEKHVMFDTVTTYI